MNNKREKKTEHYAHKYEKIEREIPHLKYYYFQCKQCGLVQYPIPELQKLWVYSEKHQFMFIQDWVLALLYAQPMPVVGITSLIKQLFLIQMEFAQEQNIPSENPGFRGYKFGPYAERIEDVIIGLEDADLIHTEGRRGAQGEYFILTEKGKIEAEISYKKLAKKQQAIFSELRLDWHQLGSDGLMKYIYRKYPEYAKESIVLARVLHKRRLGTIVWEGN
jgi:hypothetical protein